MASLSSLLRAAAAKPEPKPKAMVPLGRRQEAAPLTPILLRPDRPTLNRVRPTLNKAIQAPLTPATPGAQSSRPPSIKQQIESYFGDQGLKSDVYLQDLIRESEGGWVSMDEVLRLKRIQALRCSADDILHALHGSWLETWQDDDGSAAIRRPPNRPIPKLEIAKQIPAKRLVTRSTAAAEGVVQAAGKALFPGRLKGTVRTYDEETGSATLASPQTEALFQKDIVVGWRELKESAVAIKIGSLVTFRVQLGPDGEPRARDLELRAPEVDDEDPDEDEVPRPPKRAKAAAAVVGQRYIGTIKTFHEGVGLGFISCKATFSTYGRDVSVHRNELSGFQVGDEVSFELAAEPGVGTPKAITLEAPSAPQPLVPRPPCTKPSVRNGAAKAPAPKKAPAAKAPLPKAMPKRAAPKPQPKAGAAAATGNSRRWKGVVESFDEAKGVGRITFTVNGATRRCLLDREELAGFIAGDSISFKLLKDAAGGPPKAVELEAEDD